MKTYSISGVSRFLGIDPKTLRRWVRKKAIPAPKPGIVGGRLSMCWEESDVVKIRQYKKSGYWGKGINRKTGEKAKAK
jgi:predicted site-specific integrase-resolvase